MNVLDWRKVDILVSTPTQLDILIKLQANKAITQMKPKFFVLDEFDMMLTDKKYSSIVKQYLSNLGSHLISPNQTEDIRDRRVGKVFTTVRIVRSLNDEYSIRKIFEILS